MGVAFSGDVQGQPQVIFPGGDGWLYSFDPRGEKGKSKLLWKFDCNPKTAEWKLGGQGTRNNIVRAPIAYRGMIYVATGQDPLHGDGPGLLWCINPNLRGDVSPELVYNKSNPEEPIPHRREQACGRTRATLLELTPTRRKSGVMPAKTWTGMARSSLKRPLIVHSGNSPSKMDCW